MNNKEAIRILKAHQLYNGGLASRQYSEKRLKEALNVAISLLESELKYCQCKVPHINPKWGGYECMKCDKTIK